MAQDWGSAAVCLMKILITEGQVSFFNFRDKCYTCDPIMFLGLGAQESVLCEEPARIQEFAVSIVPCICDSSSYSLIMSTNQLQRHAFHKRPPGASCKKIHEQPREHATTRSCNSLSFRDLGGAVG